MMFKNLCEEFRRLEGQPVKIFTDDERIVCGIVLQSGDYACRVLDRDGDVFLVEYAHIASVEEPQMRLHCRHRTCCPCVDDERCGGGAADAEVEGPYDRDGGCHCY